MVSFEILVNGGKSESFKLNKGLRQGDPLSPYLFILGQEMLSRMLDKELRQRNISGIRTSRSGPIITHMMYADDIILFSKASKKDATTINHILNKYCLWFSQQVNREKSGILFSKHTQSNTRRSLKSILQMRSLKKDTTYLGAPLLLSRAPAKDFS